MVATAVFMAILVGVEVGSGGRRVLKVVVQIRDGPSLTLYTTPT
jgi:hypothetical protein